MSKEKQIDEMAKDLCHLQTCEAKKNGGNCYKYCKAYIYAFRAYNAGYRKQSEGEWYVNYMMSKKPSKRGRIIQYTTYTCSVCGKPNGRKKSKFCPNCGAKMKGGGARMKGDAE